MRFNEIEFNHELRQKMFQNKINTTLIIDRTTLGFDTIETDVPSITNGFSIELPPTIVDGKMMFFTSQDDRGRWLRTMLLTYYIGGKVKYKKIDENDFEVNIIFA